MWPGKWMAVREQLCRHLFFNGQPLFNVFRIGVRVCHGGPKLNVSEPPIGFPQSLEVVFHAS